LLTTRLFYGALFEVLKLNTEGGSFDSLGDWQSMFSKVQIGLSAENISMQEGCILSHIEFMEFVRVIGVYGWISVRKNYNFRQPGLPDLYQ